MNGYNGVVERMGTCLTMPTGLSGRRASDTTRVWLVDDNAAFRSLLANLLDEQVDFKCERQFSSPPEILEALSCETAPDIILLDIQMGEHDGLDAIRPIKALAPDTHVLMLTTFAGPDARERAFREGASDFMRKSWTIPEIASHMRQAMEFGSVAGLMTAFLSSGMPVEKPATPKIAEMTAKTSGAERWFEYLRGWLKLSPS
jgi:DNA-binding NarL/FixJ family response regulator